MVTKNTEGISSNSIVLFQKFADFIPRASSALRSFPTFLALDFSDLLDALGKMLKLHIIIQPGLKKLLDGFLDLSFYRVNNTSIFSFLQCKFLALDLIFIFLKIIEALKTRLLSLTKNGKKYKMTRIISFS